jgi:hypothetical protein
MGMTRAGGGGFATASCDRRLNMARVALLDHNTLEVLDTPPEVRW